MADKTVEERQAKLSSYFDNGPGPAGVMLPPTVGYNNHDGTRVRNPAYSLGLKLESVLTAQGKNTPGPIYLIPKGMTAKGPDTQLGATIKSRAKLIELGEVGPGPAAFYPDINLNRRRAPAYSLSYRHRLIEMGQQSPGPIYLLPPCLGPRVPDKLAAAEVTIKGRGKTEDEHFRSPGPIYDIGSPNLIKNKGGEVTIKSRWAPLKSQSCGAGPGSYNVSKSTPAVWRKPPAFSIGVRHSPFAGVLMTDRDKCESGVPNLDDC